MSHGCHDVHIFLSALQRSEEYQFSDVLVQVKYNKCYIPSGVLRHTVLTNTHDRQIKVVRSHTYTDFCVCWYFVQCA